MIWLLPVVTNNTGPDRIRRLVSRFGDTVDANTNPRSWFDRVSAIALTDTFPTTILSTVPISSGSFGVYTFADVAAGGTYTVSVTSRRYRFGSRVVSVAEALTTVDFARQE